MPLGIPSCEGVSGRSDVANNLHESPRHSFIVRRSTILWRGLEASCGGERFPGHHSTDTAGLGALPGSLAMAWSNRHRCPGLGTATWSAPARSHAKRASHAAFIAWSYSFVLTVGIGGLLLGEARAQTAPPVTTTVNMTWSAPLLTNPTDTSIVHYSPNAIPAATQHVWVLNPSIVGGTPECQDPNRLGVDVLCGGYLVLEVLILDFMRMWPW
jgi:hypothetical protein